MTDGPPIRSLATADLVQAHALTQAIRWPHRLEDWQFALAMGDGVAIGQDGRLLGTAMSWAFGPDWGCFGMLIVDGGQQGRGLGARLMDAALGRLGGRAVQLHATPAGEPLYRRLGFAAAGAIHQHQGVPHAIAPDAARPGERLRPGGTADLAALAALDTAATGMDRARLLVGLLAGSEVVILDRDGAAAGFAMLRRFGRGKVIGPVVAPDAEAATRLIAHLLGRHQGAFLRIDITDRALSPWLEAAGLACVDEALRMVRGGVPAGVGRFALVNQAMG